MYHYGTGNQWISWPTFAYDPGIQMKLDEIVVQLKEANEIARERLELEKMDTLESPAQKPPQGHVDPCDFISMYMGNLWAIGDETLFRGEFAGCNSTGRISLYVYTSEDKKGKQLRIFGNAKFDPEHVFFTEEAARSALGWD